MGRTVYPEFDDQDKLLWGIIDSKLSYWVDLCKELGINEEKLYEKVANEYEIIINGRTAGLFYLLARTFDELEVDEADIIAIGDSNSAIIPTVLGLTGIGRIDRVIKVLSDDSMYCSELFYGINGNEDVNPSDIIMTHNSFVDALFKIGGILKESLNYSDMNSLSVFNPYLRKRMGINLSESDGLLVGDYEKKTMYKNTRISFRDDKTLNVFVSGEYNEYDSIVKVPLIDDFIRDRIKESRIECYTDLVYSYAMASNIKIPDDSLLFLEQYLIENIKNKDEERFDLCRMKCIEKHILSKAYIDALMINCWKIVYYQVHYDVIVACKK